MAAELMSMKPAVAKTHMMAKVALETIVVTLIKVQTAMEALKLFVEDNTMAVMFTVALWHRYPLTKLTQAKNGYVHPNFLGQNFQ